MSITVEQMRPKLYTLDQVNTALATTEPLSTYGFTIGDQIRFTVNEDWHLNLDDRAGTDRVGAYAQVGTGGNAHEFQLTKDAVLEATSICGITKTYAARCPGNLLEPQLNYWFREGLYRRTIRDYQLLVAGGAGAAITRASIIPFSNMRLLEQALAGITNRFGTGEEVLADFKFSHSLRSTHLRLIVPGAQRLITGTGTDDDLWSVGLQIRNSLIGEHQTSIDGYLFRWRCTNGQIDSRATSGAWSRHTRGGETEVYDWARTAVDDVLGGLEPALDAVQAMVDVPIEGQANEVLRAVFEHYKVPLAERHRINENMVEHTGKLNMYTLLAAITSVANDPSMEPSHVENLLRVGGDLPHAATSLCEACRQLVRH